MKIKTAYYKKKFPTFQFLNEDIGFEGELDDTEDPLLAIAELKRLAEKFHREGNPHLYQEPSPEIPSTPLIKKTNEDSKNQQIKSIISSIETCTEIKVLESYQLIAKSNPQIQQAYDNQLNKLQ